MRTVVLGERPPELEALIARRRHLGLDMLDEVWEGDYHMNAAPPGPHSWLDHQLAVVLDRLVKRQGLYGSGIFNLGTPDDFRVPARGVHRSPPLDTWFDTAAMVVEVLSPDDETWDKLPFYAAHGVDELLIVDAEHRAVHLLRLSGGEYEETPRSALLEVSASDVTNSLEWPPSIADG